ncbi:MAG: hypothetical protein DRI57_13720 [Deltaproteobacteria bacterium]|nr:MAG: hypothetical protein DRI57_13720 [Deltaproteobacteria bacterium]
MINSHFQAVEKTINDDPLVITFDLERIYTSQIRAYIKGKINFADGTSLALFQHVQIAENGLDITDYRYHYMNADGQMIFRYDNAPHHREIETFPHHKHLQTGLQCAIMPTVKDILREIDLIIMEALI